MNIAAKAGFIDASAFDQALNFMLGCTRVTAPLKME